MLLQADDAVLFAGTNAARERLRQTLENENVCDYVLLGRNIPGGTIWQHFTRAA